MIYQYFTVDIIVTVKEKWGFIDQKTFKTARQYGFDLLILTDAKMAASRMLDIWLNLSAISSTDMIGRDHEKTSVLCNWKVHPIPFVIAKLFKRKA